MEYISDKTKMLILEGRVKRLEKELREMTESRQELHGIIYRGSNAE